MLGSKLRKLQTGRGHLQGVFTYTMNLITKDKGIFFTFFGAKFLQGNASFGLFNGNEHVLFLPAGSQGIPRIAAMQPGYRISSAQSWLFTSTVGGSSCDPAWIGLAPVGTQAPN